MSVYVVSGPDPVVGNGYFGRLAERPVVVLALLCVLQCLFWTIMPSMVDTSPPGDVAEGLMWGREWVLLTYKHPQLPPWLLHMSYALTGVVGWPQFLLAQLSITATFILVYVFACDVFGRDTAGKRKALASVLLLPSIFVFGWPSQQFNHDFAQLPFWALITLALWRSVKTDRLLWWIVLGLAAGIGMHAKFSTGLLLAFGGLWLLIDGRGRKSLLSPRPWIGLALFLIVVAPLAVELVRYDFMPLTYANDRSAWVQANRMRFAYVLSQMAWIVGLPIVLASAGLFGKGRAAGIWRSQSPDARMRFYVFWMGIGPAAIVAAASLFEGIGEPWGTTMYNLAGIVAIILLGGRLTGQALKRIAAWAVIFIIGTSSAYAATQWLRCNEFGVLRKVCWPAGAMSKRFEDIWHQNVSGPLGIVGGDNWIAMLTGIAAPDSPSIFTDLNMKLAPWITPERLRRQGMLLVWEKGEKLPAEWKPWLDGRTIGTTSFEWSAKEPPVTLSYLIVPPGAMDLSNGPPRPPASATRPALDGPAGGDEIQNSAGNGANDLRRPDASQRTEISNGDGGDEQGNQRSGGDEPRERLAMAAVAVERPTRIDEIGKADRGHPGKDVGQNGGQPE